MNATKTQADGLTKLLAGFNEQLHANLGAQQHKAKLLSRLDDLVGIESFIGEASRLECKHIINMLIDRVSTLDGLAPELEDAACSLTRSIEADGDAADSLRAYMEGRDES